MSPTDRNHPPPKSFKYLREALLVVFLQLLAPGSLADLVVKEKDLAALHLDQVRAQAQLVEDTTLPFECQRQVIHMKMSTLGDVVPLKVYHYWVEMLDGEHVSENATVVTPLKAHTLMGGGECDGNLEKNGPRNLWVLRPELNCLQQGEYELTRTLLENYLVPPPQPLKAVDFERNDDLGGVWGASQEGVLQDQFLDKFIFKGQVKNGFFVEAGADDFLLNTNTLQFELLHGWTGLLVEPFVSRFELG